MLRRSLTWAYVLLSLAYLTVGVVGYVLYGNSSHELILMDLGPSGGQRVSHSTRVLLNIMLAALTIKARPRPPSTSPDLAWALRASLPRRPPRHPTPPSPSPPPRPIALLPPTPHHPLLNPPAFPCKALCAVPVELLVMTDVLQRELQSSRGIRLSEQQSLQLRMLLWLPAAALSLGAFETARPRPDLADLADLAPTSPRPRPDLALILAARPGTGCAAPTSGPA